MKVVGVEEEMQQQLRSKATELLLREDWKEYISLYSHFISLCHSSHRTVVDDDEDAKAGKLNKTLCLALANRAEARLRLRDLSGALEDCNQALGIDPIHTKTLLCKGKILLELDLYSQAAECFQCARANQPVGNAEAVRELLEQSRKLEAQSKTGAVDLSEWILNGFSGKCPQLAEYIGPVEIRRSDKGGRGLFATKNVDAGTPLIISKAVVIGGGILPEPCEGSAGESDRMVMWKDFVNKILDVAEKCSRTLHLIYQLSTGNEENGLPVPEMRLFKPEPAEESYFLVGKEPDIEKILRILDVNCLTEEAFSAKVLAQRSSYCGVGLWILPSFVNHSCLPNARRLHIGDRVVVYASRDVKADEELTFAYYDILLPLRKRKEMAKRWGFECKCQRCKFEESACFEEELRELELFMQTGNNVEGVAVRLEEGMRRWTLKAKEKGFLRASFWPAYAGVYGSEKLMRRWERQLPVTTALVESVAEAVGGDERILKVLLCTLKKGGAGNGNAMETEKALRLGRGSYGKVMKRTAMKALFELAFINNGKSN